MLRYIYGFIFTSNTIMDEGKAGTRKLKTNLDLLEQETVSGSGQ